MRTSVLRLSLPALLALAVGACSASVAPEALDSGVWDASPGYDLVVKPDTGACQNLCTLGQKRCVTGGYQVCGDFDTDGCTEWQSATPCPTDQKCVDGECVAGCTDACAAGTVKCTADGSGTQVCALGASGCREWAAPVSCPQGQTCSGGTCSSGCVDECTFGTKQCAGDGYRTCGNFDSDTCLDWGTVTPCPTGQTCSNGVCSGTCTNECTANAKECVTANGFRVCGDFDGDPCLEWSDVTPCQNGETCSNGACSSSCQDECDTPGDKECTTSGTAFRVCGNYDSDSCLEWGGETDCATGETCVNGACEAICACDYHGHVCEPAAPGTTTPCACDADCDGGKTPCVADSYCDSWCPPGADPDCGCSCDYNEYCEADENYNNVSPAPTPGTEGTCPCDPDCEPHDYACMDDGHCDTWCLAASDPDCGGVNACRDRLMSIGWRFGDELFLGGAYDNPDSDEGAPWVLLSPDGLSGEGSAELLVEFAAEHISCVKALVFEVYGYDDSWFGDGGEMYLWNWTTARYDLLPDQTVGHTSDGWPDFFENWSFSTSDYLLCGTGAHAKCYVDAQVRASSWDNTHIYWAELYVKMGP
jgi:hypothetical protein